MKAKWYKRIGSVDMGLVNLKELTLAQLTQFVAEQNWPAFRTKQILYWLYSACATDFSQFKNISKALREVLPAKATLNSIQLDQMITAADGTKKFVFQLADGGRVESVLIPMEKAYTLCISTQLGCLLGCRFCYTGSLGFKRNLQVGEIVDQVVCAKREVIREVQAQEAGACQDSCQSADFEGRVRDKVRNVVFMGMGEPFLNYQNLLQALQILSMAEGLNISHRRITVSTAGIVPKIKVFDQIRYINLAISLNAATNQIRDFLMPINQKYPIEMIVKTLQGYSLPRRARVTIEYVLIKGINDTVTDARELAKLLANIKCKVNLIRFNPYPGSEFQAPTLQGVEKFLKILHAKGISTSLRQSRGEDIQAACGQLGYLRSCP